MSMQTMSLSTGQRMPGCAAAIFVAVTLITSGCKERERAPEVFSLEGKIDDIKITPGGGEITATYFSEKHNENVVATVLVTRETEIMINGAAADLSQIKEGESARADVMVDRRGEERTYKVLKISIDRPTEAVPAEARPGDTQNGG